MRLGIAFRLLISTLGILRDSNTNTVYAADCENEELFVPYPDRSSGTKYRVCFDKTQNFVDFDCPPFLYFNERTRSCTVYLDGHPIGECTYPGEKFKDPGDINCQLFFVCDSALELVLNSCDTNGYFNPLFQKCVPKTEYDCENDIPDCFQPEFQNRKWLDKEHCEYYYECVGDIIVSRKCPSGMFLDPHSQSCMHNTNGNCQVPETKPNLLVNIETMCRGKVGKYLPDPYNCKASYYCYDESTPYWIPCEGGRYFADGVCTLVKPSTCICEDENWATNGKTSVAVPHPDKAKFYVCQKGRLPEEKSCPKGTTFDAIMKICVF
ncbi:uncharacterized protein LOC119649742 isoform X1 [Hermetia illucens]|uniref:uncharacterized protein LOC119649742 isoform X1 n=1 Tax=Hermetia illucens TaxID=343691 RepID=UPI0018CC5C2C|nr:uncharacterized protein LOC119649742 isoform X1 [Hermetia illucens]